MDELDINGKCTLIGAEVLPGACDKASPQSIGIAMTVGVILMMTIQFFIKWRRESVRLLALSGIAPHDRALRRVGFQRRRMGWHKLMQTRLVLMSERTQTFLSEGTPNSFSVLGR